MKYRKYYYGLIIILSTPFSALGQGNSGSDLSAGEINFTKIMNNDSTGNKYSFYKSEDEWKEHLTEMQFHVIRKKGTERAFTGKYWDHTEKGKYSCAGCGQELFNSDAKYDAHCGWPSFNAPISYDSIGEVKDTRFGMLRVEVHCSNCGGHLGHVFNDGPRPTGLRYCINSASLEFERE